MSSNEEIHSSGDVPEAPNFVPPLALKACEACRSRKIKCDRKTPCSACVSSHLNCKPSTRQPEKKKRVLISANYEKEVKGVHERLTSLENTIQALAASSRSPAHLEDQSHLTNIVRSPRSLENDQHIPFEGASSFATHLKQASQAFGSTTSSVGLPNQSLSSAGTEKERFGIEPTAPVEDIYKLPPISVVLKGLRLAKTNPVWFFAGFADISLTSLGEMCQKLYFPIEDCSTAFVLVVVSCLWIMFNNFTDRDLRQHGLDKFEFEHAQAVCKQTLDDAARSTPLLLDHSYRQIQAMLHLVSDTYILIGKHRLTRKPALFMLETSRPSLTLSFASAAARLCQDAGYHCLTFDSPDPEVRQKITLFWFVFILDRGLSLNFGRSPALQDYDITASRSTIADVQGNRDLFLESFGVELGYLQGDIYRELYSSRAQCEGAAVKARRAQVLGERMISLRQQLFSFENPNDPLILEFVEGYELLIHSHLALIYRAIPSTHGDSPLHFSDECINASRAAMEGYNVVWEKYRGKQEETWRSLINWTYLFSPFIAFIVIFGTVVTSANPTPDLHLMETSVETLRSAAQHAPGIAKLHDACEMFLNLAKAYLAQTTQTQRRGSSLKLDVEVGDGDADLEGFYRRDWNAMLDDWDLGLGGESAREMSSFLTGSAGPGGWPG